MKSFKKYLALPEMMVFWFFAIFTLMVSVAGFFFLDPFSHLVVFFILVLVAVVVFALSFRIAATNESLKLERFRLQTVIADLNDGVIAYDENFTILVFNKAAEQIFNLEAADILNHSFALQVKQGVRSEYKLLLSILFPALAPLLVRQTEPGVYPQIFDFTFNDPVMELRVTTNKIFSESGVQLGFIKVIHDRTREVGLLRAKSEFIEIASHQLRTPLTGIKWGWETLNSTALAPDQKELVASGLQVTKRLQGIIDDILDVSRIEEGRFGYNFSNQDLIEFLSHAVEEAGFTGAKYQVRVYFDRPAQKTIPVTIDSKKISIVLSNLIDNALKYNVRNGEVVVKAELIPGEPYAQVSVRDTGIGISEQDLAKIFAKFFRSENATRVAVEGTGLGLYIARNIVERHGGKIWAASELNRGTTFFFTLPTDPALIPAKEKLYGE